MSSKKDEFKIVKPKFKSRIEDNCTEILNIEDEEDFRYIYVSDCIIQNEAARHVSFSGVRFNKVGFRDLELSSLDLTDVIFENCDLSNINFSGAIIHRVEFINCKLVGLNLSNATLQNVSIKQCNGRFAFMRFIQMKQVILEECVFENSDFQNSDFTKVIFKECDFKLSQMSGTSLSGIDFSDSNIEGIGVRIEDVRGAIISPVQAVDFAKLLGLVIKS